VQRLPRNSDLLSLKSLARFGYSDVSVSQDGAMPRKPTQQLSLSRASQIFQMLGDETRLHIVILLDQKGMLSVTQLCQALGLSQPATSHHLALLRRTGLVQCCGSSLYTRSAYGGIDLVLARGLAASSGTAPDRPAQAQLALGNGRRSSMWKPRVTKWWAARGHDVSA
jgi:regulatory ArsR family protein